MTPDLPAVIAKIKRLRDLPIGRRGTYEENMDLAQELLDHADTLIAAAEECERFRLALERIDCEYNCSCKETLPDWKCPACIARAALEAKP